MKNSKIALWWNIKRWEKKLGRPASEGIVDRLLIRYTNEQFVGNDNNVRYIDSIQHSYEAGKKHAKHRNKLRYEFLPALHSELETDEEMAAWSTFIWIITYEHPYNYATNAEEAKRARRWRNFHASAEVKQYMRNWSIEMGAATLIDRLVYYFLKWFTGLKLLSFEEFEKKVPSDSSTTKL